MEGNIVCEWIKYVIFICMVLCEIDAQVFSGKCVMTCYILCNDANYYALHYSYEKEKDLVNMWYSRWVTENMERGRNEEEREVFRFVRFYQLGSRQLN